MTLTASEVAFLARSLLRWEDAEYFCAALVVLACAGEYVANFTRTYTKGPTLRRDNLEKRSTLLLVAALALELICLVRTNEVSGAIIGSLSDRANEALAESRDALTTSSAAKIEATGAKSVAHDARQEADSTRKGLAGASDQLARLGTATKSLIDEANRTKGDLINLAVCNAPRVIAFWTFGGKLPHTYVDSLLPMKGQVVFIEVLPDAEARRAARDIARTLKDAKWDVRSILFKDGLADGVSVQPSSTPLTSATGQQTYFSEWLRGQTVAGTLVDFLHSYDWEARVGWWTDAQGNVVRDPKVAPPDTIRIQIGLYPAMIYVNPAGQGPLTLWLKKWNQERERQEAQHDARVMSAYELQASKLPPASRAALLEQAEQRLEWEHKLTEEETRRHSASFPCQTLNPLF